MKKAAGKKKPALRQKSTTAQQPSITDSLFSIRFALPAVLILYLFLIAQTFFILQSPFPGGVDVSNHLFQISLIASEGMTPWNHWWYAGHPLLEQYPFFSHAATAELSRVFGVELAYKLVASIVFLILPVSFLALLNEFRLDEKKKAFALYFFSFSPVYVYYLEGGVFSALFSLPFVIFFFKYFVRSLNTNPGEASTGPASPANPATPPFRFPLASISRPVVLSALFLAFAALSHLLMPIAAGAFAFIYLFAFKRSIFSFKRFILILAIAFALVAFFWVPLVLKYQISGSAYSSVSVSSLIAALAPFGRAFAVYINYISVAVLLLIAAIVLLASKSDFAGWKLRPAFLFFVLSVVFVIFWVLFLPHSGQAAGKLPLFLPLVFSLLLCRHFGSSKIFTLAPILLLALLLLSTLLIPTAYAPPEIYELASWAANHTDQRALFLPQGFGLVMNYPGKPNAGTYLYDVYLLPHYFGKENYWGWFGEAAPRTEFDDRITFACTRQRTAEEIKKEIGPETKIIFQKMSVCTVSASPEEFCRTIREGAVDAVFVNRNFPEVVEFADSAECLKKSGTFDKLTSYEAFGSIVHYSVTGTESYVTAPAEVISYSKKSGTINIKISADGPVSGNVIVRESYYPYWKAAIDGTPATVEESEYGFIKIPVNLGAGNHEISLEYQSSADLWFFRVLSSLTWLLIFFALIKYR